MSVDLNGSTQNVELLEAVLRGPPATLFALVRPDAAAIGSWLTAVSIGKAASINQFLRLGINPSGAAFAQLYDGSGSNGLAQSSSTTAGDEWIAITATFSKGNLCCVYFDREKTIGSVGTPPPTLDRTVIGAVRWSGSGFLQPFDGEISQVAIWRHLLPDHEVYDLAGGKSPALVQPHNLVSHVLLFGDSTEIDLVSNGRRYIAANSPGPGAEPSPFGYGPLHPKPERVFPARYGFAPIVAGVTLQNFLDADTAMWWADDSYIDFSVADNREEFWDTTNDLLRDPGSDGSNPSGSQPLICHVEAAASHTTNRGSGGNADAGSNSGDGTSPGAYAADYSALEWAETASLTSGTISGGTWSPTTVKVGANATGRAIYIEFCWYQNTGPSAPTLTVDGVAATRLVHNGTDGGAWGSGAAIFAIEASALPDSTVTDVDLVFSTNGGQNFRECRANVYRGVGYSITPTDTGSGINADPLSDTLTFAANGLGLGCAVTDDNTAASWTNLTEEYSGGLFFGATEATFASAIGFGAGSSALSVQWAASTFSAAAFASIPPT